MLGPELGLAIWSAVDLGIKWGNRVFELCKSMKHAPKELSERALRAEACWIRIYQHMEFSRKLVGVMSEFHQQSHLDTLKVVLEKLQTVHSELSAFRDLVQSDDCIQDSSRRSIAWQTAKYALKKSKIDEAIGELEKWQATFDISWLLILKIADQTVDVETEKLPAPQSTSSTPTKKLRSALQGQEGESSVFLRPEGLATAIMTPIPYCQSQLGMKGTELLITDEFICNTASKVIFRSAAKDVRSLARKLLAHDDSGFGFLRCKGVVKHEKEADNLRHASFTFIFRAPRGLENPRSLREVLLGGDQPHSLSDVIRIAQELAKTISHVHILGFVHKNIRPESILLFKKSNTSILSPFLVGFQKFRMDGGMTERIGTVDWEQNLYCHPKRYGQNPEDAYIMQHDIYSLGVCLLEIGLWESLVEYKDLDSRPTPVPFLVPHLSNSLTNELKNYLVDLARTRLPRRMGTKYAEVVETCLTCLDIENEDFGDDSEFLDEDGILVGVRYIEKVVTRLDDIRV